MYDVCNLESLCLPLNPVEGWLSVPSPGTREVFESARISPFVGPT